MHAPTVEAVPASPPTIDLCTEEIGRLVQVFDGFWVLSTMQLTSGTRWFPKTNNRTLVFRLEDEGKPVLVVVHAVVPEAIPEVQALAASTGLPVAYVISPSGRRHLFMRAWHDAFSVSRLAQTPAPPPRAGPTPSGPP